MAESADARLQALSTLVQVEMEARKAETQLELSFVITNDVRKVLAADHSYFWLLDTFGKPRVERAANVSEVDQHGISIRWLNRLLAWCVSQPWHNSSTVLNPEAVPEHLRADWREHLGEEVLYVPMVSAAKGKFFGGLLLSGKRPWLEGHKALAGILSDTFAHAWLALETPRKGAALVAHLRHYWPRYMLALVVLLLIPVRQYVLAPAEVVAQWPAVIASPLSGVIEEVLVTPGQQVKKGDLLFTMDDTELANRLLISERAYEVAEAEYLKNAQASFDCEECRARAAELKAILKREEAQVDWARQLLERSRVKAPAEGVAVFTDVNDWVGRPVRVGERVMTVADTNHTRLAIEMPVEDAIATDPGATVVFYPNISPLSSYEGRIVQTSYEAVPTASQVLAYPLLADFVENEQHARLGLRGTAKVYGGRAPIIYLVLRKPLAWLRRAVGW